MKFRFVDMFDLNESLNEDLSAYVKERLLMFIKKHHDLLNNDVDELYLLCPVGLKRGLVELLNFANIKINKDLINKFEFLVTEYNPQDLDRIVIDHDGKPGSTTDNVYYIITNWNKFDFPAYNELNEDLLTEEKLYRIDVDNKEFFVVAGNKQQFKSVEDVLSYVKKQSDNKESIDGDLYKELENCQNHVCTITDYTNSITKDDPRLLRTINKTFSTLRKRSNKLLKREADTDATKPEDLNKVIVHHVDGNEFNDDKDNLIGLFSSNLHQILHKLSLTKHGSTYAWTGTQKVLVYNGKKYVPKTMNINIDV